MRILIIGASGVIGRALAREFGKRHEVIGAGRSDPNLPVDLRDTASIARLYQSVASIDACVCVAESGALDEFGKLDVESLEHNLRGKLLGQIDLVLQGQRHLSDGGSFTLTSGVFADQPWRGVTGGGVISGGLHSFVLSAAIELSRGLRINAVSPTMVADSAEAYSEAFPGMIPVSMNTLTAAYVGCVEGARTGEIVRAYR